MSILVGETLNFFGTMSGKETCSFYCKKLKKFKNLLQQNTHETASDSGLRAGSRVIRGGQAGSLDRSDCGLKLQGIGRPHPLPPRYPRRGETWGGSRPVRGGQAGTLTRCECEVKFPGNGRPRPLPPPTRDVVKFGVVRGPSSDQSGLGSTPKLNFSVKVSPACAANTETEVLVACGIPERGLPPLVGHVSVGGGRVFLQVLVALGTTDHTEVVASGTRGSFGVVLSHALQRKDFRLLGPGFVAVDCCAIVADELQAMFIYEHVEGVKAVAGMRVGSVGIHDNVGIVRGLNSLRSQR